MLSVMIKNIFYIVFLLNTITGYSQDLLCCLDEFGCSMNVGSPSDSLYIIIDTNHVWFIAKAEKHILFSDNPFDNYKLITDTSDNYKSNIISSFNLKICLGYADYYEMQFWHKYDFEQNSDGGIVETSYDNGQTWQNILFDTVIQNNINNPVEDIVNFYDITDTISSYGNQPGFTGLQSEYKASLIRFTANPDMYLDTLLLRFTISTDSVDAQNEGWMVDDFEFGGGIYETIKNHLSVPELLLYPNPAQTFLIIESDEQNISHVSVLTILGETVIGKKGNNITTLNIENLVPGYYLIICENSNNKFRILKFCKE